MASYKCTDIIILYHIIIIIIILLYLYVYYYIISISINSILVRKFSFLHFLGIIEK